jgi:U6 snRNA-associated Sm-like protein LSm1
LVLQDTVERLFVQNLYADIEQLLTDRSQDLDKDDYVPKPFEQASVEQVFALKKAEDAKRKKADKSKQKKLAAFGFEGEHHGEAIL